MDSRTITDVNEYFLCPISTDEMTHPVITPAGHSYERENIQKWLKDKATDPITRKAISINSLRANLTLANLIKKGLKLTDKTIPDEFIDPLDPQGKAIIKIPVIAEDGYCYDAASIKAALQNNPELVSPRTGEKIGQSLYADFNLQKLMDEFYENLAAAPAEEATTPNNSKQEAEETKTSQLTIRTSPRVYDVQPNSDLLAFTAEAALAEAEKCSHFKGDEISDAIENAAMLKLQVVDYYRAKKALSRADSIYSQELSQAEAAQDSSAIKRALLNKVKVNLAMGILMERHSRFMNHDNYQNKQNEQNKKMKISNAHLSDYSARAFEFWIKTLNYLKKCDKIDDATLDGFKKLTWTLYLKVWKYVYRDAFTFEVSLRKELPDEFVRYDVMQIYRIMVQLHTKNNFDALSDISLLQIIKPLNLDSFIKSEVIPTTNSIIAKQNQRDQIAKTVANKSTPAVASEDSQLTSERSSSSHYDFLFKILMLGNTGAGKSALLLRYADDTYTDEHLSAIGVDSKTANLEVDNKVIKLQIWDTAGSDRFRTITTAYYRGAHGFIVTCDLTDRESINSIEKWLGEIDRFAMETAKIIIVGTKADLASERTITFNEMMNKAKLLKCSYIETSAKYNINVEEAYFLAAQEMKNGLGQKSNSNPTYISYLPTSPITPAPKKEQRHATAAPTGNTSSTTLSATVSTIPNSQSSSVTTRSTITSTSAINHSLTSTAVTAISPSNVSQTPNLYALIDKDDNTTFVTRPETDVTYKIMVVGDKYVGKSSLVDRVAKKIYPANKSRNDFELAFIEDQKKIIQLQIFDQDPRDFHYGGMQTIIIVCNLTDLESVKNVKKVWFDKAKRYAKDNVTTVLVGAKADLSEVRQSSFEKMKSLAEELGCSYIECSAQNDVNINKIFRVTTAETAHCIHYQSKLPPTYISIQPQNASVANTSTSTSATHPSRPATALIRPTAPSNMSEQAALLVEKTHEDNKSQYESLKESSQNSLRNFSQPFFSLARLRGDGNERVSVYQYMIFNTKNYFDLLIILSAIFSANDNDNGYNVREKLRADLDSSYKTNDIACSSLNTKLKDAYPTINLDVLGVASVVGQKLDKAVTAKKDNKMSLVEDIKNEIFNILETKRGGSRNTTSSSQSRRF